VEAFLHAIQKGEGSPIDFESLYTTTLVTLKIIDSLNTGLPQFMHSHEQADPLAAESAVSEIMN
jgi:hypothetical protein